MDIVQVCHGNGPCFIPDIDTFKIVLYVRLYHLHVARFFFTLARRQRSKDEDVWVKTRSTLEKTFLLES